MRCLRSVRLDVGVALAQRGSAQRRSLVLLVLYQLLAAAVTPGPLLGRLAMRPVAAGCRRPPVPVTCAAQPSTRRKGTRQPLRPTTQVKERSLRLFPQPPARPSADPGILIIWHAAPACRRRSRSNRRCRRRPRRRRWRLRRSCRCRQTTAATAFHFLSMMDKLGGSKRWPHRLSGNQPSSSRPCSSERGRRGVRARVLRRRWC